MKKTIGGLLFLMSFSFIFSCSTNDETIKPATPADDCITIGASSNGRAIEGRYIVSFHNNAAATGRKDNNAARVLEHHHLSQSKIEDNFEGELSSYVLNLSPEEAHTLKKDSTVAFVEPDRMVSICACFTVLEPRLITWNIDKVGYGDGKGKTAWLIDTGIDSKHPDLNVDISRSRSFISNDESLKDENGHGTHVAGVIGAKNNSIGTLGVASGATLVALKVLNNDGEGLLSNILKALAYVRSNARRGDVVNLSLGLEETSEILEHEVKGVANKGIYVAVAAGNNSKPADTFSPARTSGRNIFTVTAVDSLNRFATFSNYGNNVVDYAAPGVGILSSYPNGRYATMSGTSMATPHVAGLLLINNGKINRSGYALNDPDGTPDPLAHQ